MLNVGMIQRIQSLPASVRGGGLVALAGLIVAATYFAAPKYVGVVILGLALAGLALVIFKGVLKMIDKGKAKPFERRLAENAGAAPMGVSDAARRARLDDLRRRFEEGVATFREHGKDIYALPWYLLVGEPGSGKTEAIRHCNVGFPPGLQDQLQGAGGTLNMNWWFTNHAIVLDTAGRLMFEEVEPGKTSEWKEFLTLLRSGRPNCPINGMLLVIPADSLIADTADALQKKGGRIAEQLDAIQRALGVRFPVFVVITKCDLINGFREFFKDVTDPQMQSQILGWSNPGDLETPFKADQVENHLRQVAERLRRRRLGILLDPVHTEDPIAGRRTDEVDSLYSFPDSLLKIAPRLRMYLDMIFVAGEWSAKPLFLRGIYFTSSMQEGAELDAEIAEALKVDVKSLPEGRGFTRNTAFFLRDLFMSKVFQEKGLVTNATNIRKQQQARRRLLLGTGVLGTMGLMGATWFAAKGHEKAVGASSDFWGQIAKVMGPDVDPADRGLITPPKQRDEVNRLYVYAGGDTNFTPEGDRRTVVREDGKDLQKFELPLRTRDMASTREDTPLMFRPIAGLTGGDVFAKETPAHEQVLSEIVLEPCTSALFDRFRRGEKAPWQGAAETNALAQALRLRAACAGRAPAEGSVFDLRAVATFCVDSEELAGEVPQQIQQLQDVIDWTYSDKGGGRPWPPGKVRDIVDASMDDGDPTGLAVGRFIENWAQAAVKGNDLPGADTLKKLGDLQGAIAEMTRIEGEILQVIGFDKVDTVAQYTEASAEYLRRFGALQSAKARVDGAVGALNLGAGEPGLARRLDAAIAEARGAARTEYDLLTGALGPKPEAGVDEPGSIKGVRDRLELGWQGLETDWNTRKTALGEQLAALERAELVRRDANSALTFERRFALYKTAADRLTEAQAFTPSGELFSLGDELAGAQRRSEAASATLGPQLLPQDASAPAMTNAKTFAERAIQAAQRFETNASIARASGTISGAEALARLVKARAQAAGVPDVERPVLPLAPDMQGGAFDASYHPAVARTVIDAVVAMRGRIEPGAAGAITPLDAAVLKDGVADVERAVGEYVNAYGAYWSTDLERAMTVRTDANWTNTREALRQMNLTETSGAIRQLAEEAVKALEMPEPFASRLSQGVKDAKARLSAAAAGLADETYREALSAVRSKWRSLPETAGQASAQVLGMTPDDFAEQYLGTEAKVYGEGSKPARVPYWSNVVKAALTDLSAESNRLATESFRSLMRNRRAAPLCADETLSLTRDEMLQTFKEVQGIVLPSPSGAPTGSLIRDGARLPQGFSDAEEALAAMRGGGAVTDQRERDWFTKGVQPVVEFLRGPDVDNPAYPAWELVILPYDLSDTHRQAADQFKEIEVSGGGLGQIFLIPSRAANEQTGVRLSVCPGQPLTIKFHENFEAGGSVGVTQEVRLDPTWSILGTLRTGKWEAVATKSGVYAVPVSLSKPGGWTGTYMLGVRFPQRDPRAALANWPRSTTWPQPR